MITCSFNETNTLMSGKSLENEMNTRSCRQIRDASVGANVHFHAELEGGDRKKILIIRPGSTVENRILPSLNAL